MAYFEAMGMEDSVIKNKSSASMLSKSDLSKKQFYNCLDSDENFDGYSVNIILCH